MSIISVNTRQKNRITISICNNHGEIENEVNWLNSVQTCIACKIGHEDSPRQMMPNTTKLEEFNKWLLFRNDRLKRISPACLLLDINIRHYKIPESQPLSLHDNTAHVRSQFGLRRPISSQRAHIDSYMSPLHQPARCAPAVHAMRVTRLALLQQNGRPSSSLPKLAR